MQKPTVSVPTLGLLFAFTAGAASCASARRYAACKGIAPRLSGTGGKAGDQQARRPVCAHAPHSRCAQRDRAPAPGRAALAVAQWAARAPTVQCDGGGAGEQDGAYRLGACGHERVYQTNYGAQAA